MRRRQEEFWEQIRLNPDDDQIRLIFADWLEEIGDERAEYIRVQCETARWESSPEQENPDALQRYLHLKAHEEKLTWIWRGHCLEELSPLGVKDVRFERGFVSRMHLEGTAFLSRTKILTEWAPVLEGVLWQKIPRQSAEPIQRFLASPASAALNTLNLMRNNLGPAGVAALSSSPRLANIASLTLKENPLGGQSILELVKSPHLTGLNRWDLTDTGLSLVDARAIARAKFHRLNELLLNGNQIGDQGLRALTNCERLKTLKRLEAARNQIGHEGVRALADSPHLTDLEVLDLSENEIGDAGITTLASASNYGRLTEFNLAGCGITPAGLANFVKSPYLNRLASLDLSFNPLGLSLPRLLETPIAKNLKTLSLRHCDLDRQCVRLLLTEDWAFEKLDLRDNPLIKEYTREKLREKHGDRVII